MREGKRVLAVAILAGALTPTVPAAAENATLPPSTYRLEADVSMRSIPVDVRFSGARLVMFGSAAQVGAGALAPALASTPDAARLDVVAVIKAERTNLTVRRKSRVFGLWLNTRSVSFAEAPRYYAVVSTRPLEEIATKAKLSGSDIGIEQVPIVAVRGNDAGSGVAYAEDFRNAALKLAARRKVYVRQDMGIEFVGQSLFRGQIDLPASIPVGPLEVSVYLFQSGELIARRDSRVNLERAGFEHFIYEFAQNRPIAYGMFTVALAVAIGLASSFIANLRRD